MAVASGSKGLEAVVLLTDAAGIADADLKVVRDFAGTGVTVHVGDPRGNLRATMAS
jgi:hypothetical protein